MAQTEINVLIDKGLEARPQAAWLRKIARQVLAAQDTGAGAELGLVITGQEEIRELNRSYRGIDTATDVLSFAMTPAGEDTGVSPFIAPPDGVRHLGEVIISYPQAVLQAGQHRHTIQREMAILVIHGVLHLLGYDHEAPAERRRMRAREKAILGHIGPGVE